MFVCVCVCVFLFLLHVLISCIRTHDVLNESEGRVLLDGGERVDL